MTLHTRIADLVIHYTGQDIYSKRKTQQIVDARSLFEYIMREDYKVTFQSISDHYRKKGKKRNHDCVMYGVNLFKRDVQHRRPDLNNYSKILGTEVTHKQIKKAVSLLANIETQEHYNKYVYFMTNKLKKSVDVEEPSKVS